MRTLHRIYAVIAGYFWLPCPACGEMFGGHESGNYSIGNKICCKKHDRPVMIIDTPHGRYLQRPL